MHWEWVGSIHPYRTDRVKANKMIPTFPPFPEALGCKEGKQPNFAIHEQKEKGKRHEVLKAIDQMIE